MLLVVETVKAVEESHWGLKTGALVEDNKAGDSHMGNNWQDMGACIQELTVEMQLWSLAGVGLYLG